MAANVTNPTDHRQMRGRPRAASHQQQAALQTSAAKTVSESQFVLNPESAPMPLSIRNKSRCTLVYVGEGSRELRKDREGQNRKIFFAPLPALGETISARH